MVVMEECSANRECWCYLELVLFNKVLLSSTNIHMNVSWTLHCNERISLTCQVSRCVCVGYLCVFSGAEEEETTLSWMLIMMMITLLPDLTACSSAQDRCDVCDVFSLLEVLQTGSWMEDAGGESMMHKADAEILSVLFTAQ